MRWTLSAPLSLTETSAQRRDVAAEAHRLREAAVDALRRRLAPADTLGDGVQHGQVLRMPRHQLAPQRERILPGRVRDLVDEALEVDRVLVQVDAAPEARRHVRIAHRVVDQQVRDRIADRRFRSRRVEALEDHGILAVLDVLRKDRGDDRLPRDPHVQRGHVALRVDAGRQLALRDRVVAAVRHVLLARPDELHRRARHLLRDQHRLAHPVVHRAAPAEAAAEERLVDVALLDRQPGRLGGGRERGFAVLRRRPDFAALGRPARRRVHRLHRRVVLVRVRIHGLDPLRRGGERGARVARLVADDGVLRVETGLQHVGERRARGLSRWARSPSRSAARRRRASRATRCRPPRRPRSRRRARPSSRRASRARPCRRRSSPCRRRPGSRGSPRSACRAA